MPKSFHKILSIIDRIDKRNFNVALGIIPITLLISYIVDKFHSDYPPIIHLLYAPAILTCYLFDSLHVVLFSTSISIFCFLFINDFSVSADSNVIISSILCTIAFALLIFSIRAIIIRSNENKRLLYRNKEISKVLFKEILISFTNTLFAKEKHTAAHSYRVANNAYYIGDKLGLPINELNRLYWAAVLHDIGKVGLADSVLLGTGKLTENELYMVKQHPTIGTNMLSFLPKKDGDIRMGILHHHEQWQGGGYPTGAAGEEIHLFGRIIAVADVFDALTSIRPYKKAMPQPEALAFMHEKNGEYFDPTVFTAFINTLDSGYICTQQEKKMHLRIKPEFDDILLDRFLNQKQ